MRKQDIINLFYIEHCSTKEIAENLSVSSAYVSKIVRNDERYYEEKQYRRMLAKDKRRVGQNTFIKNKREKQRIDDCYAFMKRQQAQDSRELSTPSHLTNESYRRWNNSAYSYNPSKRQYEFDSTLGRSADVPKYIKERWLLWKKNY